ncbi:MAG: recombinase family protein [Clostridia bacterium]|nr:recombinase family protein [Clostridia bacterium]
MEARRLREQLRYSSIYDLPLRVTFYARVSTDKDEQLNSLENQEAYFTEKIKGVESWKFVPGYIDEGISGTSVLKRERFLQMIHDAKDGKFDLILTKEVSRFARNTVDSLTYTRDLMRYGVGVFFMNDGINTLDPDSELRLTIMSGIAQDESRKISSRVKFGSKEAIKKGRVFGNSRIYGYDYVDKHLVINEEQAVFVRDLFESFATGNYSLNQLEKLFYEKGYRSTSGGRINHAAMANVIRNPKYKGWFCGGKTTIADPFDQRQIRLPEEEWVMFPDENIPALVSEEVWRKANEILAKRSSDVKNHRGQYNHANLLSCKMYCTHCDALYHRQSSTAYHSKNPNSSWVCSGKKKKGTHTCPSRYIWESEIKDVLFKLFKGFRQNQEDMAQRILKTLEEMQPEASVAKDIETVEDTIAKLNARRERLLDLNMNGHLADDQFADMMKNNAIQVARQHELLATLTEKQDRSGDIQKRLKVIQDAFATFDTLATPEDITPALVDAVIRRVDVTTEGDVIHMNFHLADGTSMVEELSAQAHSRGRPKKSATGQSRKRLIEQAERAMSGSQK